MRTMRKLMPRNRSLNTTLNTSIEEFDPRVDRVKTACPYYSDSEKKKSVQAVARRSKRRGKIVLNESSTIGSDGDLFCDKSSLGTASKKTRKQTTPQIRTMVCTFMHRRDQEFVSEAILKLGGWKMERNVSERTTHVVCGDEKRTINVLRGIAQGCWILQYEWVTRSVEAGHWLDEEYFEMMFLPGIQQCRIARETFGSKCNIFNNDDTFYVASKTRPPAIEIKYLLRLCGAKVVSAPNKANVIITSHPVAMLPGTTCVQETWVLDSIAQNMLQPKGNYSH